MALAMTLVTALPGLSACGNKGELFRPTEQDPSAQADQAAVPAAAPVPGHGEGHGEGQGEGQSESQGEGQR